MTTAFTPTFAKSIGYDRLTKDYAAYLDGQLVGYFASYHAAEVALDQAAFDRLTDDDCAMASELDAPVEQGEGVNWNSFDPPAPEPPTILDEAPTDEPPWPLMRMPEGDVLDADGMRVQIAADPPVEMPQDDEDDNWGGWRTPRAFTRQSIQIEATMRRCHNCGADHRTWACPEIRQALFADAPSWKDVALGRELCRMKWKNFTAFVALLLSVPAEHLVIYAASYQAFVRSHAPESDMTINQVLQSWTRDMRRGGDNGPAALRMAA